MAAAILQLGCTIQCPHQGTATVINTNQRAKVSGSYALLADDVYTFTGCAFVIGNTPHPCVSIEWQIPAQKVKIDRRPVLLQTSVGLCKAADQAVQGTALISGVQNRVKAT